MKAAYYDEFGDYRNLRLVDIEMPQPKKDEVRIRVEASGVNDYDRAHLIGKPYVLRMGNFSKPKFNVLGCEVSGVVDATGSDVIHLQEGDKVLADLSEQTWGGFGRFTVAKASTVAKMSEGISFIEAAALPHSGVLAIQAARKIKAWKSDKHIAINGAGGGAGNLLIRLAKKYGMTVTAIDKQSKLDYLLKLGADHVVDYKKEDYFNAANIYDFIIDLQAHARPSRYRKALKKGGKFVMVGGSSSSIIQTLLLGVPFNFLHSTKLSILTHRPNKEDLEELVRMYEECDISPIIDSVFELSEIHQAFEKYEQSEMCGKIVIDLSDVN